MTTTTLTTVGEIAVIDASSIHWLQFVDSDGNYNSSRNSRPLSFGNPIGDFHAHDKRPKTGSGTLAVPLSRGWESRHGTIEVEIATDDDKTEAVTQRQTQLTVWAADEETREVARTAAHMWGFEVTENADKSLSFTATPQSGEMVEYVANMCYRRGYAIPAAVAIRNYGQDVESIDYGYPVAATLVEYDDDKERLIAHLGENLQKTEGRSAYATLEFIAIARDLVGAGGSEADIVRAGVKRGTAQKLYPIAKLDAKYRSLKLVQRCLMQPPETNGKSKPKYVEGGYIDAAKLDKERLRRLLKGYKEDDAIFPPAKKDEIEAYIAETFKGTRNKTKAMDAKRLEALAESSDVDIVRVLADAIRNNKSGVLDKMRKHADAFNVACSQVLESAGIKVPNAE